MDNSFDIQLNGTNKEKAEQLVNQMKHRSLSKEVLDAILPFEKDFYKCLVEAFRAQLNADSKDHKEYIDTINSSISNLSIILPNENLDSETRRQIIDLIAKITDDLKDLQESKNKESSRTKRVMIGAAIAFTAIGIAVWLFGGNTNGNNNRKS